MIPASHEALAGLIFIGMCVDAAVIMGVALIWKVLLQVKAAVEVEGAQVSAFIVALDPATVHELVGLHTRRLNEQGARLDTISDRVEDHDGRLRQLEQWRTDGGR